MYTALVYVLMSALVGGIAVLAIIGVFLIIREVIRRMQVVLQFNRSGPSQRDS